MTLDIAKFITNSIKMQAKIQHLKNVNVKTAKESSIPNDVKTAIIDEYGDKYLLDADYITFLWGSINKNTIKSIFNVVNKALGESANKLTDTDFKKINIVIDNEANNADVNTDIDIDQDIDDDVEDVEDIEVDNDSEEDEDDVINEEDDNSLTKTSYFFLKITLR